MAHIRLFACLGLLLILFTAAQMVSAWDLSEYSFCVDPGHGGSEPGAIGPTGLTEKEINLTTSLFLSDSLEAAGATVYITREEDITLSLSARSGLANAMAVDRCISVHHNASSNPSANYTGVHVYVDIPEIDLHMASKVVTRLDSVLNIGVVSTNCGTWGVHADNFHMVREPNMPCCLTENSFISNPAEETRLRDSTYLNTNATAIFTGLAEHMETSPEPPPPTLDVPVLHSVLNDSSGSQAVIRWFKHPEVTLIGYRIYRSVDAVNWGSPILYEDSLCADDTTVTIGELEPEQIYYFKMVAIDTTFENPESDFSNIYCLRTTPTRPPVLIVDGFDRRSSWLPQGHPFAGYNGRALNKLDIFFETCANDAAGVEVNLEDYDALIWILGDEGTADESFDIREQGIVQNYLEGGGKLFVTGSEIGYDLARGTAGDQAFYRDYLKADYVGDDANDYTVTGVAGTIFEGLSFSYGQTYEEDYPDYINAYGGSTVNLKYSATMNAGVEYQGTFGPSMLEGKLVHMGFPWETIGSEGARDQIMSRVMNFFGYQTGVQEELAEGTVPGEFRLFQNYPNPFNPTTTIFYQIPSDAMVTVSVYNVQGQRVRTLIRERQMAGYHSVSWNGRDDDGLPVASAVYFCQLRVGTQTITRKMTLIR